MLRLLLDGYLPYLLAFGWMVAVSRLPLRRLLQNAIAGLFLLLLLLQAMPAGKPGKAVCVLTLIGVGCFSSPTGPIHRNLPDRSGGG